MPLLRPLKSFIYIPLLFILFSACSKSENTEVRSALKVLALVRDMCHNDSFPKNDSILNTPLKVLSRENMDSCLAVAYFCQGEIRQHNYYILRAIDSYLLAEKFAGADSMLHFRINLRLAQLYRLKMRSDMDSLYIGNAGRLLNSIRKPSVHVEFLHEKALYYTKKNDLAKVYSTLRNALSIIDEGNEMKADLYKHLSQAYLSNNSVDSVLFFADRGLELCTQPKLRNELLILKGQGFAVADKKDSVDKYIFPNIYSVDRSLRIKAFRQVSEMYNRLGMISQSYQYLKDYTLALDTLIADRRGELMEKIHGVHEYNIQRDRANKAEMQAASSQLMFSKFVLGALVLIMILSVLLHHYRSHKRKLTERLRMETCLKMEETIKRRDVEISLARKQEELKQKEIEKLNKSIDYFKQLNNVTLPVIMRRQNAQGALHLSDDDWNIITGNTDACFDMFTARLKKLCPQLTEDDIRFCCLVKMELSMSTLSEIYHIAKASISRRKMRLKEKMGIENTSFDEFIIDF